MFLTMAAKFRMIEAMRSMYFNSKLSMKCATGKRPIPMSIKVMLFTFSFQVLQYVVFHQVRDGNAQ